MEKLQILFKNCYGIRSLINEFSFHEGKSFIIYALNGSMKTSFANVFKDISDGKEPKDRIFPNQKTEYSITDENCVNINAN